ncbi:hypothetical protein JQ561_28975 [Bradyrhizobium diazoefficiens]|nr:hypothetical protein [Bradyrhizobium diazoefficiens]MBR0930660.1 hypothetical protein [Bradyrhizobium diazoefficiens]
MVATCQQMAEDGSATTGAAVIEQAKVYQQAIHREQRMLLDTHDTQ